VTTDAANCKTCGNACPGTPNGKPSCALSTCGVTCNAGYQPSGGACIAIAPDGGPNDATAQGSIVFASSGVYGANFGNLANADTTCQGLANGASLAGTYRAWLSDGATSAASRLTHGTRPYVLVNGTVVASNWGKLTSGALQNPIDRDEHGTLVTPGSVAWTDTQPDGTGSSNASCSSWTSTAASISAVAGSVGGVDGSWTFATSSPCDSTLRLYCIQQ
jgi:hypothetical protein